MRIESAAGDKGSYIGVGMWASFGLVIGAGVGATMNVALHNVEAGLPIGAVLGLISGAILDAWRAMRSWKET